MKNKLCKQYLDLTLEMAKKFYANYYWDDEDEYADLESDFNNYCYLIWASDTRPRTCRWPLDVNEWQAIRDINDIRTALEREIPKVILHEFYTKHREDYNNKETYCTINLRHYYRQNYDKENYEREKEQELIESKERVLQSSYALDDALWAERWTSFIKYYTMKTIPHSITSALDTIAHYFSLHGQSFSMWWDFYQIDFKFDRKSDLLPEEIKINDEFNILPENVNDFIS